MRFSWAAVNTKLYSQSQERILENILSKTAADWHDITHGGDLRCNICFCKGECTEPRSAYHHETGFQQPFKQIWKQIHSANEKCCVSLTSLSYDNTVPDIIFLLILCLLLLLLLVILQRECWFFVNCVLLFRFINITCMKLVCKVSVTFAW